MGLKVHDILRGTGSYSKTKNNIMEYISGPPRKGKPAWKDIWITMTINSINYTTVRELADEWLGKINKIGFQFHTPFVKNDPLWLPFGETRDRVVDDIILLKQEYPKYIVNTNKQIS